MEDPKAPGYPRPGRRLGDGKKKQRCREGAHGSCIGDCAGFGNPGLRIEKAFGVSMDLLMRMQNSYDIARARKAAKGIKVQRWKMAG